MKYKSIIEGCKKGKAASQRSLVGSFAPIFKNICLRYLPDDPSAQDAVQEAFINVFKNIHAFRNEGSFEGWMKRIAVRTALGYRKKYFKVEHIAQELSVEVHDHAQVPDVYSKLGSEALEKILQQLPEHHYIVFNMYVVEGFDHNEIAEILDIAPSTSRSTLTRARKKLIDLLKGDSDFNESFPKKMRHEL